MDESKAVKDECNNLRSMKIQKMSGRIPLVFTLLFLVSLIGYFSTESHLIKITFAHLGGLGIVGILGSIAGVIATKKGYTYLKVLSLVLILPILLGSIAVILFKPISCGGSISFAVALLLFLYYLLVYLILKL